MSRTAAGLRGDKFSSSALAADSESSKDHKKMS